MITPEEYNKMSDEDKRETLLKLTHTELKQLGIELWESDRAEAARGRPKLTVVLEISHEFQLKVQDSLMYLGWDGELTKGPRVARFVSASDAVYFAGLHGWTVRKGTIR